MKYVIRRAVVGLLVVPVVAVVYVAFCAVLIGLGAGVSFPLTEAVGNGILIGYASAVVFTFYPQISKLVK